jgi:LEA14-like dessication related protein
MYQLNYDNMTGKVSGIKRTLDSASIPICEGNSDYQAFLEWNAKQVVPLDLNSISQAMIATKVAREEHSTIETLIQKKLRDNAISDLKKEGKLDSNGKLKK